MSRVVPQLECPIDVHLLKAERSAASGGTPPMNLYIRTDDTAEKFDQWYQWKDHRFTVKGVTDAKLRPLTGRKASAYWSDFQICAVVSTGEPRIICIYDRQTLKLPAVDGSSAMKKHCTDSAIHIKMKSSKGQEAAAEGMDVRESLARQGIHALQVRVFTRRLIRYDALTRVSTGYSTTETSRPALRTTVQQGNLPEISYPRIRDSQHCVC